MPNYKNRDINMYYEDIGIGEPIVFLHGSLSRSIISFACQMSFFQATAEYRCILPDLRGHGRTVSRNSEWTTPQLADDVIDLMDGLHISKAHLIGHSLGGDVALYCAIKYPERLFSITSISSSGFVNGEVIKWNREFECMALADGENSNFIKMIKNHQNDACKGDWGQFVKQHVINTEKYPDLTEADFQKISVPSLFIFGVNDNYIMEDEISLLKTNIPSVRVEMIEGCGHNPHNLLEKPMVVNEILYSFLKKK